MNIPVGCDMEIRSFWRDSNPRGRKNAYFAGHVFSFQVAKLILWSDWRKTPTTMKLGGKWRQWSPDPRMAVVYHMRHVLLLNSSGCFVTGPIDQRSVLGIWTTVHRIPVDLWQLSTSRHLCWLQQYSVQCRLSSSTVGRMLARGFRLIQLTKKEFRFAPRVNISLKSVVYIVCFIFEAWKTDTNLNRVYRTPRGKM